MWLAMWWCYFVYKILLKFGVCDTFRNEVTKCKIFQNTVEIIHALHKKNRNEILLWKWELYVDLISRGIAVQDWELKIVRATVLSSLLHF